MERKRKREAIVPVPAAAPLEKETGNEKVTKDMTHGSQICAECEGCKGKNDCVEYKKVNGGPGILADLGKARGCSPNHLRHSFINRPSDPFPPDGFPARPSLYGCR